MKLCPAIILIGLTLCSCQTGSINEQVADRKEVSNENLVMATLYNYYSAEYKALAYQAYNLAEKWVDEVASSGRDVSKLAVVVDIDETILDNSPYQGLLATSGISYPEKWNEWCNMSVAKAVPGALEFLNNADSLGFAIFYISNRKQAETGEGTLTNLALLGFPQLDAGKLMLRLPQSDDNPDPSNKDSRRSLVQREGYEIILFIGDNLGDFFSDSTFSNERINQVESNSDDFGMKFIVLPNAMYGNWTGSLGIPGGKRIIDSLLSEMTRMFRSEE